MTDEDSDRPPAPWEDEGATSATPDSPTGDSTSPSDRDDAPLDELAASIDERRERPRERPEADLFTEEDVQEIDTDVVWKRLDEGEPADTPTASEGDVRVVEKASYCERCPFFSAPPSVGCDHDGTSILELVDMDHFRVVDCPKVRESERLEQL